MAVPVSPTPPSPSGYAPPFPSVPRGLQDLELLGIAVFVALGLGPRGQQMPLWAFLSTNVLSPPQCSGLE